jgi:predicted porin
MKTRKVILMSAALGLASVGAQAQSMDQLQQALAQAQAAAAQAQAAAKQAQAALEQALAAAAQAKQSSAAMAAAEPASKPISTSGFTITKGANSATLYGLIDVTLVNKDNANKAGQSITAPPVAWFSGNRWGITGSHATGTDEDSLKAIFRLESEFESETGNMDTPGTIFNRDAWLGIESKSLGKLTFGRQNALARDPAASATYGDPYGSAKASLEEGGYSNTNNFKQLIFYAGSSTGTRINNGVVWKKAFSNGVVAGAAYSFGTVIGSFGTGSSATGSLAYNGSNYTIAGFATSANISDLTHRTVSFGGNMQVNPLIRLNAGYFNYTAQQAVGLGDRKDNAWTLSTKLTPGGPFDYELGYQVMSASNAGVNGSGYVQNAYSDTSAIKATASGDRSTVYGSIFYHLDKVTEFYLAADHLSTTDGYLAAQANGARSQNEVGVGMRYKF